jgi:1-acyl-sn-glycerol-3-phosphate acyltransferase
MKGPLIVVSNHVSLADPPTVAAGVLRRRIRFMAKIEVFKMPWGIFPTLYDAFPVRRFEADMSALMNAERVLRNNQFLGMFPEGTRTRTGQIGKPHPGTALIALRAGAPVLPCAISGTEDIRNLSVIYRRPKITFTIGEPIYVEQVKRPTDHQIQELTDRIWGAIMAMLPEKYLHTYTEVEASPVTAASKGGDGPDNPGD